MKKITMTFALVIAVGMAVAQPWVSVFTSSKSGQGVTLAEGNNGDVFMAFHDQFTGKPSVKKFSGGSWTSVGDSIFGFWAGELELAVKADGNPVVAFQDVNKNFQLTVMDFNGSQWDTLGTRGFSGFTSSGEVGLTANANGVFVAFQQYNQIKGWIWDATNKVFNTIGSSGIISSGFPGGCDLASSGTTVYVVYRDNTGKGIVRSSTSASNYYTWSTIGSGFGSPYTEIPRFVVVPGNILFAATRNSQNQLFSYFYFSSKWNQGPGMPTQAKDFRMSMLDSNPIIATRDAADKCHFFRGNLQSFRWDSLGSTSIVSNAKLGGTPAIIGTSDKRVFIAYSDDNNGGKITVLTLCENLSAAAIIPEKATSSKLCPGSTKKLSISKKGSYAVWYRDAMVIAGESGMTYTASQAGKYKAKLFNGCNDSIDVAEFHLIASADPIPVIANDGTTLSAGNYAFYQWTFNGTDITSGGASQTYTPTQGGVYSVKVVNADTCIIESAPYTWWPASGQMISNKKTKIYPNPAGNSLQIEGVQPGIITICDFAGRILYKEMLLTDQILDISKMPKGMLLVHLNGETVYILHE